MTEFFGVTKVVERHRRSKLLVSNPLDERDQGSVAENENEEDVHMAI